MPVWFPEKKKMQVCKYWVCYVAPTECVPWSILKITPIHMCLRKLVPTRQLRFYKLDKHHWLPAHLKSMSFFPLLLDTSSWRRYQRQPRHLSWPSAELRWYKVTPFSCCQRLGKTWNCVFNVKISLFNGKGGNLWDSESLSWCLIRGYAEIV